MATPDDSPYAGMTLNERLFTAGLLDRFDQAVRDGDRSVMAELLAQVDLAGEDAQWTIRTILARPGRHGRI